MEEKRAKTCVQMQGSSIVLRVLTQGWVLSLEALLEFIKSQKALLARTRSDIEKLQELKNDIIEGSDDAFTHVIEKVCFCSLDHCAGLDGRTGQE